MAFTRKRRRLLGATVVVALVIGSAWQLAQSQADQRFLGEWTATWNYELVRFDGDGFAQFTDIENPGKSETYQWYVDGDMLCTGIFREKGLARVGRFLREAYWTLTSTPTRYPFKRFKILRASALRMEVREEGGGQNHVTLTRRAG